ncbi:hypothetical protein [Nocardia amikacinitolerans]|uniref:hypothetical protein n=1 Tax=Nocardia amikacinitolerans TaxID=756689 RepID=UPI0020A39FF4|nr:hypothetical protein [Nocardia amikacinitolerans]
MLELAMLVIMVTLLVALLVSYRRGRRGFQLAEPESGTLYVTGVSPRPDAEGEQYVTITGNVTGPSVPGTVVYGRFVWDVNQWPAIGDYLPVVYPPGKPERWQIAHPGSRPGLGS